jgi:membrane-bound lytic murein transglycosylase B
MHPFRRFSVTALLLLSLTQAPGGVVAAPASYESGSRAFVAEMAGKHGFTQAELAALMAEARYQQRIIDAMNRPYEAKPWRDYQPIFVTPERIQGGVAFWRDNAALLARAEAAYGVPPQIIAAIIGVETNYGRNLGDHRVIDALSTLGFAFPRRADFFRGELEEFLLLTRDEQVDPLAAKGSYAGAVGKPQFIPSSYRAYAVDFDRDGRRDLWASNADVVGSVGNYLAQHGWRRGQPVAVAAELAQGRPSGIAIADKRPAVPEETLARLAAAGVSPAPPFPPKSEQGGRADSVDDGTRAALIELDGNEPEYWLGFDNFYAITRYNHSNLYAMAVYQLSREIARDYREAEGD